MRSFPLVVGEEQGEGPPLSSIGMTPLLALDRISKSYGGVRAVNGVSFSLVAGEIVALIGPNGAGKSTCFKMLSGQVKPDSGRIFIAGRDTAGLSPQAIYRLGIGRTFQITETFTSMTVRENVQVALLSHHGQLARIHGFAGAAYRVEADALLDRAGILDKAEQPASELAYGDLKRLELAIALTGDPVLLLMDEPAAGMGPPERIALMRLVTELARQKSMGILFTEHDMDIVFGHAQRILVLDRGTLVAEGSAEEVRRNPQVQAIYLGGAARASIEPVAGAAP
jgi:branched-chain amino acid transport system ATP-binding protein